MKGKLYLAIVAISAVVFLSVELISQQFIAEIFSLNIYNLNQEFRSYGLQHLSVEVVVLCSVIVFHIIVKNKTLTYQVGIAAVIVLFYLSLIKYAVNIPITDDYKTILKFSNAYFFTDNLSEKLKLYTSFHGECRLIFTRTVILFQHIVFEQIDIKYLIIFANTCLLGIVFIFYKSTINVALRTQLILIIALLFFQFGYYDAIVWATDAMHYQFTVLFVMLALYFLEKRVMINQLFSMVFALLATLTFGNGLLIFPLVLLYHLLNKNFKIGLLWLTVGVTAACFYFKNFSLLQVNTPFFSLFDYFKYSCCFIGGAFQFMYMLYLPFTFGFITWLVFILLTIKAYYKKNYLVYGLLLFVLLSSLIAGYFRLRLGVAESISNRYGIFSILAIVCIVISIVQSVDSNQQKTVLNCSLVVFAIYHLLTGIFFFPEVPIRKKKLETFIIDLKQGKQFNSIEPIIPPGADKVVREAIKNKIYFP